MGSAIFLWLLCFLVFFFKGKIKPKFCPSLKIWKRIILRFREVHSRTFYDIYASLGRGQEMRAFWTWPLFLPSVSWGLAKGLCHLRTPWNPCPQAPLLTAPLTLFLHKSTVLNQLYWFIHYKKKKNTFLSDQPIGWFNLHRLNHVCTQAQLKVLNWCFKIKRNTKFFMG